MSLKGVAGSRESPRASHLITQANELFAGIAASIMTVDYGLSFAALIFSASLHTWLAYGIAATFMTTAIAASFVAARSSLPFAIAAPDGATAAVTRNACCDSGPAADRNGAARRPFGPRHDRCGSRHASDRHPAFLSRPSASGRRDPLHPLPGYWGIPECHRLVDGERSH